MRRVIALTLLILPICSGCQAGFMVTRILMGDPKVVAPFESATHVKLDDQEKPVFVVCTLPSVTTERYESLAVDLPDGLMRLMKRRGIPTGDAADAIDRVTDFGGQIDPHDLGSELDAGYLVFVDLERYSLSEDGGNTLYRGRASGNIAVYEIQAGEESTDGDSKASTQKVIEVFHRGFDTSYPGSHPVPVDQLPASVFEKRFRDHLAEELGHMLYSYRMSDAF